MCRFEVGLGKKEGGGVFVGRLIPQFTLCLGFRKYQLKMFMMKVSSTQTVTGNSVSQFIPS